MLNNLKCYITLAKISVVNNETSIQSVMTEKVLGKPVDSMLNFKYHIVEIVKRPVGSLVSKGDPLSTRRMRFLSTYTNNLLEYRLQLVLPKLN